MVRGAITLAARLAKLFRGVAPATVILLPAMLYMVIERFRHGLEPVYQRFSERGRMLPDGLRYIDSWLDGVTQDRCFQLMETDDPAAFDEWAARWNDLVDFEFVPVTRSPAQSS